MVGCLPTVLEALMGQMCLVVIKFMQFWTSPGTRTSEDHKFVLVLTHIMTSCRFFEDLIYVFHISKWTV